MVSYCRTSQLGIIAYIISYALIHERGYQEFSGVESSVITKVNPQIEDST